MAKIIDPDKLVSREVYDSVKREYKISLIEDNKNLELKKWLKEHKPTIAGIKIYTNGKVFRSRNRFPNLVHIK